jgi:alpha-mannosidase
MWECRGGRADVSVVFSSAVTRASETDLLERSMQTLDFAGSTIELEFKPFQIRTLRVNLSSART